MVKVKFKEMLKSSALSSHTVQTGFHFALSFSFVRFIVSMLCDAEHLHEETVDLANPWYAFYSIITHLFSAVTLRFGMSWQPKSLLPDIFLCNLTIVSSFIFFFAMINEVL